MKRPKTLLIVAVIAIVAILIFAAVAVDLIPLMGKTTGKDDSKDNTDDTGNNGNSSATEGKANFVITAFGISKHQVLINYPVAVTVGLLNNGTADGTYKLNITIDDTVVRSSSVPIGKGDSTTVSYNVSWSGVGNHTVAIGDNSTYLNCYDFYAAGSYMKYHTVETFTPGGTQEFNYTVTMMAQTARTYTVNVTYENDVYPPDEFTTNKSGSQTTYENLVLVGAENLSTAFGNLTLDHYSYEYTSGSYHYVVDSYEDHSTGVVFKRVTRTDGYLATETLIDTNREWIRDI